jgi:hypothetical protein
MKYELGFYIPKDGILHSHCRENPKSYKTDWVQTMTEHLDKSVTESSQTPIQIKLHLMSHHITENKMFMHRRIKSLLNPKII